MERKNEKEQSRVAVSLGKGEKKQARALVSFGLMRVPAMPWDSDATPLAERYVDKPLRCGQCGEPITGDAYAFGGGIACEACVRDYYSGQSDVAIARELRERRYAYSARRTRRGY